MAEVGQFFPWDVSWFHWEPYGKKGDPWSLICTEKIKNWSRNGWATAIFPLRCCVIPLRTTCDKRDPWVLICTKNIQNWSRNGWVMAIFPLRGFVIPLRTKWDRRASLRIDLCHKDPKSVKKWLRYGYFPTERLRDSIENHMGQKGILGHWFVPTI